MKLFINKFAKSKESSLKENVKTIIEMKEPFRSTKDIINYTRHTEYSRRTMLELLINYK